MSQENLSLGFQTRSDTNWTVDSQKMARVCTYWIKEEEELYYICSENIGADQLCSLSASLVSHMQKAGFLMTGLIYLLIFLY